MCLEIINMDQTKHDDLEAKMNGCIFYSAYYACIQDGGMLQELRTKCNHQNHNGSKNQRYVCLAKDIKISLSFYNGR